MRMRSHDDRFERGQLAFRNDGDAMLEKRRSCLLGGVCKRPVKQKHGPSFSRCSHHLSLGWRLREELSKNTRRGKLTTFYSIGAKKAARLSRPAATAADAASLAG